MKQSFKKALYGIAIFALFTVAAGFVLKAYDAIAADVTYKVIRGATKKLKDMGDGTHAPTMFIAGHQMIEATAVHFDLAVSADTYYLMVDLDDTTNYPHSGTDFLVLCTIQASARQSGDAWRMFLGIITAIDGTDTTIKPLWELQTPSTANVAQSVVSYPAGGINLEVSGGAVTGMLGADITISAVTTSTNLGSPAGTVNAEVGDLLLWVDELSGTATFDWAMTINYNSE